jgi:hypothetical protein
MVDEGRGQQVFPLRFEAGPGQLVVRHPLPVGQLATYRAKAQLVFDRAGFR